jgi:hypothetical protein
LSKPFILKRKKIGIGLAMYSRLASNSWSLCLRLPSAGIIRMCHHAGQIEKIFKCSLLGYLIKGIIFPLRANIQN